MPHRSPSSSQSKLVFHYGEWRSVLKLSTKWQFNQLRQLAIEALDKQKIPTMNLVVDAYLYDIPHWLIKGYIGFINGLQSLKGGNEEDEVNRQWMARAAEKIGYSNVIELQSIVLARYRRAERKVAIRTAEEDIKESPILSKQFQDMMKKARMYEPKGSEDTRPTTD